MSVFFSELLPTLFVSEIEWPAFQLKPRRHYRVVVDSESMVKKSRNTHSADFHKPVKRRITCGNFHICNNFNTVFELI